MSSHSFINRTIGILFIALAALLSVGCGDTHDEACNVVLVVVDTLRPDHCSAYGYDRRTTPELERMASLGVLFENAYAQASFTQASMGTLLTGTWPHNHAAGQHPSILLEDNETLAELFQQSGYATAAFVCNPLLTEGSGFEQGFDDYYPLDEKEDFGAKGVVDSAIAWLEKNVTRKNGDEPFFLWLHMLDPHFPYLPPKFEPPLKVRFSWVDDRAARQEYLAKIQQRSSAQFLFENTLSPKAVREAINIYDSEVAFCDLQFGRLVRWLENQGVMKDTLLVFTSDHGESLGEHGFRFSHGFTVYDEAIRVPLVVRLPGRQPGGARIDDTVQLMDLAPFMLSVAGIPCPDKMKGRGLMDFIEQNSSGSAGRNDVTIFSESEPMYLDGGVRRFPLRPRIYIEGDEGKWRSVRKGDYKLIMIPRDDEPELELYNVKDDPLELKNLAEQEPTIKNEMLELIRAWRDGADVRESTLHPDPDSEWQQRLQQLGYAK